MIHFTLEEFAILMVLLPSSALIYYATSEHIVIPARLFFLFSIIIDALCIPLLAYIQFHFGFADSRTLIPILAILFPFYYRSVDLPFWRSLVVFLWAGVLMTFPLNFAFIFNALLNPETDVMDLKPGAFVFQCITAILLTLILRNRLKALDKTIFYESRTPESIWFSWLSIPFLFLSLNIAIIPADFVSLSGANYSIDLLITLCLFLLYLYLTAIFSAFMNEYIHVKEYEERQHLIDIQNLQYKNLQNQMDMDKKARHDYKHSLRLLFTLAQNEKWDELKSYIAEFAQAKDGYIYKNYSTIPAINAVLNYYMMRAEEEGIAALMQVALPDKLAIPDPEFCSLIGNIMENAIDGCLTLPEQSRRMSVSISLDNEINLYIVSTNTFDENQIKMPSDTDSILNFPSTKHKKSGIGLRSIKETADKYNGTVRLSHNNNMFFLDIAMVLGEI